MMIPPAIESEKFMLYFVFNFFIFIAFACKAQRFAIVLLPVFFPRRDFCGISGNSEQKNNLQTTEHLIQFSQLFFSSILFLNKLQRRGIPQRLVDNCSHLFICISLRQTLSSGQKSVLTDMNILEQMALAATFYFGPVVFCRCSHYELLC